MPLIARQRSRLAVLAVLALVGSLLAVSAVPAVAAKDEKATATAMYSACVGAATEDAGFTDTGGNFAEDAINCLSHYGITQGTSEGVFSPNDGITRAQMALFMARAAGVAGIELDDPEDQGLGDIGNWTDVIQDAVNQVVAAKIMSGSNGMFNPTGAVSRADMAVILDAFLTAAGVKVTDFDGIDDDDDIDMPFSDIDSVPVSAYHAINRLYEFGVAQGTTASTFTPGALVSRAQMAAFVTRALAHTNARPAGITVQGMTMGDTGSSHDLAISVRDMNHQPVPDALVDVIATTKPDEAFNDDGACVTKNLMESDCTITTADEATDPDGNTDGTTVMLPDTAGTLTVKVWTGEVGDKFDKDDTSYAAIEIDAALPATAVKVTDNTKKNSNNLKFGDTVTYTLQVVNADGDAVAEKDVEVTVQAVITDTTPGESGSDMNPSLDGDQLRSTTSTNSAVHKTDAAGRIQLSYTQDDPDGNVKNRDEVTLTLTVMSTPSPDVSKANDQGAANQDGIQVIWADDDAVATTLTLSQRVMYHETNDDGVSNSLMATLVDQYGDPVRSVKVKVWSTVTNPADGDSLGLGGSPAGTAGSATDPADRRTTSRRGVATKTYTREATAAETETLGAQYATFNGECEDATTACDETDDDATPFTVTAETVMHYWAARAEGEVTANDVLVADKDNNTIVLGPTSGPQLVTYKAGDQFTITANGAGVTGPTGAVTMEVFEKALSTLADSTADTPAADSVSAVIGDDEDDINSFTIATNN